jgi:hypothetical protein
MLQRARDVFRNAYDDDATTSRFRNVQPLGTITGDFTRSNARRRFFTSWRDWCLARRHPVGVRE